MPQSENHKKINKTVRDFFNSTYGVAITEFYDSGFELDVFTVTISSISIMVETIWTASKQNFYRDLTIVLSSNAQIKVVIVNPEILAKKDFVRYFERIKVSEAKKGYCVIGLLGWIPLSETSFLENLKCEIDKILEEKGKDIKERIKELKNNIYDDSIPLARTVSNCLDLVKEINLTNDELWLEAELYGYYRYLSEKNDFQSLEDLPGTPEYRRIKAKINMYFPKGGGLGDFVEKELPIAISQPINEIQKLVKGMRGQEVALFLPLPDFIHKSLEEYGGDTTQKMPAIVSKIQLERLIEELRVKLHQLLKKIEEIQIDK